MKKFLIFVLGVITGIALTFLLSYLMGTSANDDVTWFESPGDTIKGGKYEVFQVLGESSALVNGRDNNNYGVVYLLVNDEGKFYYDDEIINVPNNKVVRQVGIYRYETNRSTIKTVPIIQIFNK